jgi:hypothetical protein
MEASVHFFQNWGMIDRKLKGDSGGKDATLVPEEVTVMTIFG